MSAATPYICFRCLRASRQIVKPSALSRRAYSTASTISSPAHPRAESRTTSARLNASRKHFSTTPRLPKPETVVGKSPSSASQPPPPSTSTSSSSATDQYTTTTILNQRFDEETGEEMKISLTPRATKRLLQIMAKDSNPSLCLRVTVESGGCHGFQYLMSLVDMSKIDESEDVLFVGSTPDAPAVEDVRQRAWREVAKGAPKVVIDESSLELLKGSKVDYTMELIGSQFKIDNPKASSSCGCGTSFDIKV